jgi:hypothetical protein
MSKKNKAKETPAAVAPQKKVDSRVEHPSYYNAHPSGVECIDIVRHYNFNVGNVIKCLWQHGLKREEGMNNKAKALEDLRKARFYLDDEIKRLEREAIKEDRELCRKSIQTFVIPFSDIVAGSRLLRELLNTEGKAKSKKGGR